MLRQLAVRAATVRERVTAETLPNGRGSDPVRRVFTQAALAASVVLLAATFAASVGTFEPASATSLSIHWFWLAAVWLLLAWEWPPLLVCSQLALVVGVWLRLAEHGVLNGLIGLAHLNAIVAGGVALSCIAFVVMSGRLATPQRRMPRLLLVELALGALLNAIVLAPAWTQLVGNSTASQTLLQVADAWGWAAALLTAVALWAALRFTNVKAIADVDRTIFDGVREGRVWLLLLFSVATLIAWTACQWDTGDWLGFRVLLACHVAVAWIMAGGAAWRERAVATRGRISNVCLIALAFAVGLAAACSRQSCWRPVVDDRRASQPGATGRVAQLVVIALWIVIYRRGG